ncbi:MAG: hypothetical protein ACOC83_07875 [Gemmatimonadota bacterium]
MHPSDFHASKPGHLVLALVAAATVGAAGCEPPETASPESGTADAGSDIGTVQFSTSCSEAVQPTLERGLLLLHHMMYAQAEETFVEAAEAEEDCAMAHWGVAMSRFQPFWGSSDVEAGRPAAERALELDPPTDRERLYAEAALAFHEEADASHMERVRSWEAAMEDLHESHPDDPEAAALYALAHLSAGPDEPDRQERAIAILEELHDRMPRHPGAIHYAIHAHDVDGRGEDGVPYARAYSEVAPSIPHALHMPSHIYVRTGDWDQVIDWNARSAEAALDHPAGEDLSLHYPHALDYLMYGYLQRGEDSAAAGVQEELRSRESYEPHMGSAYALAAIPARWHVERADWEGAAEMEARVPSTFPWDDFPAAEAITHFARGLGAARSGDVERAQAAADRLAELADATEAPDWTREIGIQRSAVLAWISLAEGRAEEAVERMRTAADEAAGMEKNPITPGALRPAGELLGELLLEVDRPAEALEAYETSLDTWPRRYHSLLGAARAAEEAGQAETAEGYRSELAELTADADPERRVEAP